MASSFLNYKEWNIGILSDHKSDRPVSKDPERCRVAPRFEFPDFPFNAWFWSPPSMHYPQGIGRKVTVVGATGNVVGQSGNGKVTFTIDHNGQTLTFNEDWYGLFENLDVLQRYVVNANRPGVVSGCVVHEDVGITEWSPDERDEAASGNSDYESSDMSDGVWSQDSNSKAAEKDWYERNIRLDWDDC